MPFVREHFDRQLAGLLGSLLFFIWFPIFLTLLSINPKSTFTSKLTLSILVSVVVFLLSALVFYFMRCGTELSKKIPPKGQ